MADNELNVENLRALTADQLNDKLLGLKKEQGLRRKQDAKTNSARPSGLC